MAPWSLGPMLRSHDGSLDLSEEHEHSEEHNHLWYHLNAFFQQVSIKIFTRLVSKRDEFVFEYANDIMSFRGIPEDKERSLALCDQLIERCEYFERHFRTNREIITKYPRLVDEGAMERLQVITAWRNTYYLLSLHEQSLKADPVSGISQVVLNMLNRMTPIEFTKSYYLASLRRAIVYAKEACRLYSSKWTELGFGELGALTKKICRCKFDSVRYCIDTQVDNSYKEMSKINVACINRLFHLLYALGNLCEFYEEMYGIDELVLDTRRLGCERVSCLAKCIHNYVVPEPSAADEEPFRMISRHAPYRHWAELPLVLQWFPGSGRIFFEGMAESLMQVIMNFRSYSRNFFDDLFLVAISTNESMEKLKYYIDRIREMLRRIVNARNAIARFFKSIDQEDSMVGLDCSLLDLAKTFCACLNKFARSVMYSADPLMTCNLYMAAFDLLSGSVLVNLHADVDIDECGEFTEFCTNAADFFTTHNVPSVKSCRTFLEKCVASDHLSMACKLELSLAIKKFEDLYGNSVMKSIEFSLDGVKLNSMISRLEERIELKRRESRLVGRVLSVSLPRSYSHDPRLSYITESLHPGFDWKKLCRIGDGPCGSVFEAMSQKSKKIVALKEIGVGETFDGAAFLAAMKVIVTIQHPNLIEYHGYVRKQGKVCMVMEYCGASSLKRILAMGPLESLLFVKSFCKQILHGLACLHTNSLVHNNLKPENVLVCCEGVVKLSDYGKCLPIAIRNKTIVTGSTKEGNPGRMNILGNPAYLAPEVLEGQEGTPQSDIWSFGCILLHMMTGRRPFDDLDSDRAVLFTVTLGNRTPDIPLNFPDDLKEILSMCFERDRFKRPSAIDLLTHSFFAD